MKSGSPGPSGPPGSSGSAEGEHLPVVFLGIIAVEVLVILGLYLAGAYFGR
jgi:hypothetical protein